MRFQSIALSILCGVLIGSPVIFNQIGAAQSVAPMSADTISQKLPRGLKLKMTFVTGMDAAHSQVGDAFLARVAEDIWVNQELMLPQGSTIRGRVKRVEAPKSFGKGGLMQLDFDHVVMPSGELRPMHLTIDPTNPQMNLAMNALYTDPGLGRKLDRSVDAGVQKYQYFKNQGQEEAKRRGGSTASTLATVPPATVVGFFAGVGTTTAQAAKSIFGKGDTVTITPGDQLVVDLAQAITLPAQ